MTQQKPVLSSPLENFARSRDARERALWFRVAIDYYFAAAGEDRARDEAMAERFVDALAQATPAERFDVVKQLALAVRPPAEVIDAIVALGGDAGLYALQHCVGVSAERLVEAIAAGAPQATAIAGRPDLAEGAVDRIVRHAAIDATLALIANDSVGLSAAHRKILIERARAAEDIEAGRRLARALLSRPPLGPEYATLFMLASPPQRVAICATLRRLELGKPSAPPRGNSAVGVLEDYATQGDERGLIEALAKAIDCDVALAKTLVEEPSGDGLLVALASLGAREDAEVRILASVDLHARVSRGRVGAIARLKPLLDSGTARRVLDAIKGAPSARPPVHRPQLDATASPTPSRATTPAQVSPAVARRRRAFAFAAGRLYVPGSA